MIIIPLTSAGFIDWFKKTITGQATNLPTNVSVTISGTNDVIIESIRVVGYPDITLIEGQGKDITINVVLNDTDGVNDINDSSVQANISNTADGITRSNTSCVHLGDLDAQRANYSCVISMWYWDIQGVWNVSASGEDLGTKVRTHNISETNLSLGILKALTINPLLITWVTVNPGGTNAKASNETFVNNTGNYNSTINVTGINIYGETITTESINVSNFTAGSTNECDITGVTASYLINNTAVTVNNTFANRGNLSIGSGTGQEKIFWCIPNVPYVSSQTYSTNSSGGWIIAY